MCSNVKSVAVGAFVHPAIMFMNSNKSESNIRQIIQANRQKCSMAGIALMNETIVNKGPNRDIDRDAVNILITRLIGGQYDTVVVESMADIAADESDLKEFMHDAANIGVGFFEISTMQYHMYDTSKNSFETVFGGRMFIRERNRRFLAVSCAGISIDFNSLFSL